MAVGELIARFGEQPADPEIARLLGAAHGVLARMYILTSIDGADDASADLRELTAHSVVLHQEDQILERCEALLGDGSPYRYSEDPMTDAEAVKAVQALRALLARPRRSS